MPSPKKDPDTQAMPASKSAVASVCAELATECPGINGIHLFTAVNEQRPDYLGPNVWWTRPDAGIPSVVVDQLRELASAADQLIAVINRLQPGALEILHRHQGTSPEIRSRACLIELPNPTDTKGPWSDLDPADFESFDDLFALIVSIEESRWGSGWQDRLEALANLARAKASAVEQHTRKGGRKRMEDYLHGFQGSMQKRILMNCEEIVQRFGLDPKCTIKLARAMYQDMTGKQPANSWGLKNLASLRQTPSK